MSKRLKSLTLIGLFSLFALLAFTAITPMYAEHFQHAHTRLDSLQQATADPTLDDAVATLFAQTAQAASPDMTQVVATAFSAAQTATADASDEGSPEVQLTPQPTLDVASLSAEVVQTYDLVGGPTNTAAYLSPAGDRFVYIGNDEICLYTIDGEQQHCSALADEIARMDRESVAWSRDSRYVAFALPAFVYLIDSDLWVYDTEENTLTNVTPDDTTRLDINKLSDEGHTIDLSPRWTDDGRLWFVRIKSSDLGDVMSIDVTGENPEVVYEFTAAFQYYLLDVTRDGSAIALTGSDPSGNATVLYEDLENNRSRSIRLPERFGPGMLTFSPDGQYLLLLDGYAQSQMRSATTIMHVLDVTTSRLRPVDATRVTLAAGWLPNQSSLVYTTFDPEVENIGLYVAGTPGEPGEKLLDGHFFVPTSRNSQPIWISDQNTLLLTNRDNDLKVEQIALEAQ